MDVASSHTGTSLEILSNLVYQINFNITIHLLEDFCMEALEGLYRAPSWKFLFYTVQWINVQDELEAEGNEAVAIALIELALELHPVETESVEESRQPFHD